MFSIFIVNQQKHFINLPNIAFQLYNQNKYIFQKCRLQIQHITSTASQWFTDSSSQLLQFPALAKSANQPPSVNTQQPSSIRIAIFYVNTFYHIILSVNDPSTCQTLSIVLITCFIISGLLVTIFYKTFALIFTSTSICLFIFQIRFDTIFDIFLQSQNRCIIYEFYTFCSGLYLCKWVALFDDEKVDNSEIMILIFFMFDQFRSLIKVISIDYNRIVSIILKRIIQIVFQKYQTKNFIETSFLQAKQMNSAQQQNKKQPVSQQLDIFSIAFGQRKRVNLDKVATYFKERQSTLLQRRRIFLTIQQTLFQKIQASRQTIKQFIRFFQQIITWYEVIFKRMKKLDIDKKTKQICQYQIFHFTICKMQQLNNQQQQQIQNLVSWIQKTVIPSLKNSLQGFKDQTKVLRKQVQNIFNNSQNARFQQDKFYQKIQDNNDLLENEIYLVDRIEITNNFMIQWGERLFKNWQELLKKEAEVRELLKNHILDYNRRHCKIYTPTQTNKNINDFWSKLQKQPQIKLIFNSFLQQKDIAFISFGSKNVNFYDKLQQFIKLAHEDQRIGNMLPLIQILQNKYFKCKLQKQKKQWAQTKLYFSLDQHILIFDEEKKKLLFKVNSKGIQYKKITQNMLELIGKQTGVIFDSTRKQMIHFKTVDELDQFVFYVDNIMEENNPQYKEAK